MKESEFIEKVKKNAQFESENYGMGHVVLDDPKEGIVVATHKLWQDIYKKATPLFVFDQNGNEVIPPDFEKKPLKEKCEELFEESWEDVIHYLADWCASNDFDEANHKTQFPESINYGNIMDMFNDQYRERWERKYEDYVSDLDSDAYMAGGR